MKDEDKVYHQLLEYVLKLLGKEYPYEMVAAALMAIAQRLYKTHLSKEDYEHIMKVAYEAQIEPYDITKGTLH